jgi:hypothetical protein
MRTIFVRVADEASPSYALVARRANHVGDLQHRQRAPRLHRRPLEFGPGENARCKTIRLLGPKEATARQRMNAVERIP